MKREYIICTFSATRIQGRGCNWIDGDRPKAIIEWACIQAAPGCTIIDAFKQTIVVPTYSVSGVAGSIAKALMLPPDGPWAVQSPLPAKTGFPHIT